MQIRKLRPSEGRGVGEARRVSAWACVLRVLVPVRLVNSGDIHCPPKPCAQPGRACHYPCFVDAETD